MDIINKLQDKSYIKNMNEETAYCASEEIRQFLMDNVTITGGHLASNLGVVELTLAIHKVFDFPEDKIIFDVGHQCYVHKILSGRAGEFSSLRQKDGLSGFPKTEESIYDSFNTGHSSTSISAAIGMARARDLKSEKYNVISFIGDGALGGGMAFEALNDIGASKTKIIIILNDNEMSISKNVGGLSSHLSRLRLSSKYLNVKNRTHKLLDNMGFIGKILTRVIRYLKRPLKFAALALPLFEGLGIKYLGIIDGHNFEELTEALELAKTIPSSVIIHTVTKKGKGYFEAEDNPSKYHGISPKEHKNTTSITYTDVFGEYLFEKARSNNKIVSITAAMSSGCGLTKFSHEYPERFFDVGIAEQHAVTMAAGMAINGVTPIFSVYSTFLQRAYDQVLHDVCLQNLHVIFSIDRAGAIGEDGETHQGTFDFSYLLHLPNITILAPSCKEELKAMLDYAISDADGPVAIRFPKANCVSRNLQNYSVGIPQVVYSCGYDVVIFAIGRMVELGLDIAYELKLLNIENTCVIDVGMIKPLNTAFINDALSKAKLAITLEDNVVIGGAGEYIAMNVERRYKEHIFSFGFGDEFIKQGTQKEQFEIHGLNAKSISQKIAKELMNSEQQT